MKKITELFHEGELEAQNLYNNTEWSDRAVCAVNELYREALSEDDAFYIESVSYFFLSTADDKGHCDCSYRGTEQAQDGRAVPAAIVINSKRLVFPDYSGNNMYNSLGNIRSNPNVGLLFIDFSSGFRLRVNGGASIVESSTGFSGMNIRAKRFVEVAVNQVFWNCKNRVPKHA